MAIARDRQGLFQFLFKGRNQRTILGCCALKSDPLANDAVTSHFKQVVFAHRMQDGAKHFVHFVTFGEEVVDIPLHEHGAAIGGQGRALTFGAIGHVGQGAIKALGLFFNETAGARGADVIHDALGHRAFGQGGELGVLAADLNDGIHLGIDGHRGSRVGRDLVQDAVRAHDGTDELAPGTGAAHRDDLQLHLSFAGPIQNSLEQGLHGQKRSPRGAGVKSRPNAQGVIRIHGLGIHALVQKHGLGRGGTNVDAQRNPQTTARAGLAIDIHLHGPRHLDVGGGMLVAGQRPGLGIA